MDDNADQNITDEEHLLAEKLRKFCTISGEERPDCLEESADILFQLGKLYLGKAADAVGMPQKLSFIRSTALLIGAKVRYSSTGNEGKLLALDCVLTDLCDCLFSNLEKPPIGKGLFALSEDFSNQLQKLRQDEQSKINDISKIPDDAEGEKLVFMEKCKIKQVCELTKAATKNYTSLMVDIALKCKEILGHPPCEFALVGLGSLARGEITLYSDFEHVVVLKDGIQHWENYQDILEYFRWFAVLFQIIMIGLGETFIRSVGIKSINDLYSEDPAKNWFYDAFTPCGVCFDGMVPHSCNNPLGRQEPTKNKSHIVELIRPVGEMAKLLSVDENLKNGYYLKDVLTRTCLVHGDEDVYRHFKDMSWVILHEEGIGEVAKDYLQKMQENCNLGIRVENLLLPAQQRQEWKVILYRPITTFLSYLGRALEISATSSFDIIDELHNQNAQKHKRIINEKASHQLQYAVAVACEVRMRAYSNASNQRHGLKAVDLVNLIGLKSATDSRITLQRLNHAVKGFFGTLKQENGQFISRPWQSAFDQREPTERAEALLFFGFEEEALDIAEQCLLTRQSLNASACIVACLIYCMKGHRDKHQREVNFQKAIELGERVLSAEGSSCDHKMQACSYLALCYYYKGEYRKGLDLVQKWNGLCAGLHPTDSRIKHSLDDMDLLKLKMELPSIQQEKKVEYLLGLQAQKKDFSILQSISVELADAYGASSDYEKARTVIMDVIHRYPLHEYNKLSYLFDIRAVLDIQLKYGFSEDALSTAVLLDDVICCGPAQKYDVTDFVILSERVKIICLKNLKRFQECIATIEAATDEMKVEHIRIYAECVAVCGGESDALKVIDVCKTSPKDENCANVYALQASHLLLQYFLNDEQALSLIRRIFADAPIRFKKHKHIYNYVFLLFRKYSGAMSLAFPSLLKEFFEHLIQPTLAYLYMGYLHHRNQSWADLELATFRERFLQANTLSGGGFVEDYNRALKNLTQFNAPGCVLILWDIIVRDVCGSRVRNKSIDLFYCLLLARGATSWETPEDELLLEAVQHERVLHVMFRTVKNIN